MTTKIKTESELKSMRFGGNVLSKTLNFLLSEISDGISAYEINRMTESMLQKYGVKPAFLGFKGFPASICVSVNDEVVHGIPSQNKIVKSGDIVSLDLGVNCDGMIVDGAVSFAVGQDLGANDPKKRLLEATKSSLNAGISSIRSGCRVGDISSSIQKILDSNKLSIIRDLVGHGVGHSLHEEPNIPNYGKSGRGMKLVSGMTLAIEPMSALGRGDVYIDSDGWTVKTKDASLSAQFEHTVLVTDSGSEILTMSE